MIAVSCLLVLGLLFVTRPWSVRLLKVFLILSAVEWLRTLISLVLLRQEHGMPWTRLAFILGAVALFTAVSTLVFRHPQIRKKYIGK